MRTKLFLLLSLTLPLTSLGLNRVELLPPEARTYIRVSNTAEFWSQLKKSSLGRLWQDPQFQNFLGNPDADAWQDLFFDGDKSAEDEILVEQMKMLKGEVILAFDLKHDDPLIIAAMSKEDFNRSLDLDDRLREMTDESFDIRRDSFQDMEIIEHIEDPGTPKESHAWQTHIDETFIMGNSREWVEQSIVRLRNEQADEPEGKPTLNLNLPLARMVEESISKGEAGVSERALLEALGITDMESFSSRIELLDDRMTVDNTLRIGSLGKGLFTLLDVQPSELPTVTFIPESIATIEVGRFNLLALWQEIPNVLMRAQPEMKPQFDMLTGMIQQQAGINLEQDLLAHLGKKYVAFSTIAGNKQDSVMAVDLEDGVAFKKGFETALAAPAMQPYVASGLEIEPFLDHTIYTLKQADPNETMGIAITGDYLLYGTPDGLRQVIRSVTSDAAANQAFERTELVRGLREVVPPRAFGYSAIDWKKSMKPVLNELLKPAYIGMLEQKLKKQDSLPIAPDFSKLPPSDHIASFFNISYQYVEAGVQGLHQKIILKY